MKLSKLKRKVEKRVARVIDGEPMYKGFVADVAFLTAIMVLEEVSP